MMMLFSSVALFAAGVASPEEDGTQPAQAVPPTFTAEGADDASASWYYVVWDNSDLVLTSKGIGENVVLGSPERDNANQLFKLVGDIDEGFRLINKNGKAVYLDYKADDEDKSRFVLKEVADLGDQYLGLTNGTADTFEIFAYGTNDGKCMNTWGGSGPGIPFGIWNKGDRNNQVRFKKADEVTFIERPEVKRDTYYFIQFAEGGAVLQSRGEGKNVITARPRSNDDAQLWKVVGSDLDHVEFVCKKDNIHLIYSTEGSFKGSSENGDLRVVGSVSKDYPTSYVIGFNGTGEYDNVFSATQEGGAGSGKFLGKAHHDNKNNAVNFVLPEDMTIVEPTMPTFSSLENGNVWYRLVFANHPNKTKVDENGKTKADKTLDESVTVVLAYAPERTVRVIKTTGEGDAAVSEEVDETRTAGLVAQPLNESSDDQLFRIVGTPEKFELFSKNGQRVSFEDGKFIFSNMQLGRLMLRYSDGKFKDAWEISRPEATNKAFNIDGGLRDFLFITRNPANERLMGEWNLGDDNNALRFVQVGDKEEFTDVPEVDPSYKEPQEYVDPKISSEANGDIYYAVEFVRNNDVLTIADDGVTIQAHPFDEAKKDKQLFRLVGSSEKLELLSKDNVRIVYSDGKFILKNDAETYLSLVELASPDHAWELHPEGDSQGMNLWSGHGDEMIGKYNKGDSGNALRFLEKEKGPWTPKPELETPKRVLTLPGVVDNGSVAFEGLADNAEVAEGTEVTLVVTPDAGYELETLTVGGVDVKDTKTFTVGVDNTIIVTFKKVGGTQVLTLPAGIKNGTVSFEGINEGSEVAEGTEVTLVVTPDAGYELETLTVGGVDVKDTKKFVVGADNTIVVTFKKTVAVEEINVADVKVIGRKLILPKTQHVLVYSLTGVKILEVKASVVLIPETAGQVVLVKIDGKVLKLAL